MTSSIIRKFINFKIKTKNTFPLSIFSLTIIFSPAISSLLVLASDTVLALFFCGDLKNLVSLLINLRSKK